MEHKINHLRFISSKKKVQRKKKVYVLKTFLSIYNLYSTRPYEQNFMFS